MQTLGKTIYEIADCESLKWQDKDKSPVGKNVFTIDLSAFIFKGDLKLIKTLVGSLYIVLFSETI